VANVSQIENWSGPYKTRADAIEGIRLLCGSGYEAAIWKKGRHWYINDGIDPDTGKPWVQLPQKGSDLGEDMVIDWRSDWPPNRRHIDEPFLHVDWLNFGSGIRAT
jgi:hypothetical protein